MSKWIFGPRVRLKPEKLETAQGNINVEGQAIEIELNELSFVQGDDIAFRLAENEVTVSLKRRNRELPSSDTVLDSTGVPLLLAKDTEHEKCAGEEKKSVPSGVCQTDPPLADPPSPRSMRKMLFDNVVWKEPHSMTLEAFSALNSNMRYGSISELKAENVEFAAGWIRVSAAGISVDTTKWRPEKGGGQGQFHVELPQNGLVLSLFVFRPVSELVSYKDVRDDVPYRKSDEYSASGCAGGFKW